MWAAMDCASGSTPERAGEVSRQARNSRFGSSMNFLDEATCRAIGAADLGEEYRAPISSLVPVLFVSGAMDSQTPPHQAERIRWGFPEGRHLVVENAGHESTLDVPEVLAAITRFLRGEPTANRFVAQRLPAFRRPGS
jgi:pimeloyl-ACP methyl ester carboxylesterase